MGQPYWLALFFLVSIQMMGAVRSSARQVYSVTPGGHTGPAGAGQNLARCQGVPFFGQIRGKRGGTGEKALGRLYVDPLGNSR